MPAAPPGTMTQTWRDATGAVTIEVVYHFDPATGAFPGNPNPAIDYVNNTGRPQTILVQLTGEATPRQVQMPVGSGSVTRNQISSFTGGAVTSFYGGGWTLDQANF